MKRLAILLLIVGCSFLLQTEAGAVTPVASQKVLTAASKNVVDIGLSYRGDQIHFFGANPVPGSDLIIKLTAEKEEVIKFSVKGKVGPFWMTVKQYEVSGSPFMYKIHSSKPITQIIADATAQELELGYPAVRHKMKMHLVRGEEAPEDSDLIFKGLIKIKEESNLYNIVEDPKRLEITEGKLFKHYFRFPPAATEGIYLVESFCFDKGEFVGYGKDKIEIKKVGLAHWLTETSQNHSVLYGIMAVVIAVGIGLLVGMVFGKGGHH
jgi:uncharacterized protein (TIGR02186 family)